MHELAITQEIVRGVAEELAKLPAGTKLNRVSLLVGELTGYVPESLRFCYEAIVRDSPLAGSVLEIDYRRGRGRCRSCSTEFEIEAAIALCPGCGGLSCEILQGKELLITALDVDEGEGESA